MIILRIHRRVGEKDLREFILNQIKKFRRNQKHKYIALRGEVAYSTNSVYLIFEPYALELAFALSILFKCGKHQIPCQLYLSKTIEPDKIPKEIVGAGSVWSERKLPRKFYKLRDLRL